MINSAAATKRVRLPSSAAMLNQLLSDYGYKLEFQMPELILSEERRRYVPRHAGILADATLCRSVADYQAKKVDYEMAWLHWIDQRKTLLHLP